MSQNLSRRQCLLIGGLAIGACVGDDQDPNTLQFQLNDFQLTSTPAGTTIYDSVWGETISEEEAARRLQNGGARCVNGVCETRQHYDRYGFGLNFGVFYIRFEGFDPQPHPLVPCVYEPVRHVHFIIKRDSSTDDREAYMKLHLGTFTQAQNGRRCFVMFDNLHPWICARACEPDRVDFERLRDAIQNAIQAALATAAVAVSVAVIRQAANAIAQIAQLALQFGL